jgi:hypothetical protein
MDANRAARDLGHLVAQSRGRLPASTAANDLTIAIGTSPGGLSLAADTRLSKAALLYADRVILYSPSAVMLASAEALGELDNSGMVAFLRAIAPSLEGGSTTLRACDEYELLQRKRHRSRAEIIATIKFEQILRHAVRDLGDAGANLVQQAGGTELAVAIAAGVVEIDPLLDPVVDSRSDVPDELLHAYTRKLDSLLWDPRVYPLFDDATGDLVRSHVAEGLFKLSAGANRRGKQAATAAAFVARMPALPHASMTDVLDIRSELADARTRFRAAVIRLSKLLDSTLVGEDLAAELQDIYDAEVAPALEDIAEAFLTRAYLREFLATAAEDVRSLITQGAGITLGLAGLGHLPALTATSVGIAAAGASLATEMKLKVSRAREVGTANQLYFLYEADQRLRGR